MNKRPNKIKPINGWGTMRNQNINLQSGFTIIELLVVSAIMVIIATIGIVNWNAQRSSRTLTIAQNELITNIRKIQSYAVSSRNTPDNQAVKYYLIELTEGNSSFTVKAAVGDNYTISDVETISLPSEVSLTNISVESQAEALYAPSVACKYIVFSVIFGKTYFVDCDQISTVLPSFPKLAPLSNANLALTIEHDGRPKYIMVYGLNGKVEAYTPAP